MRRAISVLVLSLAAAGCGSSGIQGTLEWARTPVVRDRAAVGTVRNTTSHSLALDPHSMRLLDDRGRRVAGKIRVATTELPAHASTRLRASWKAGEPVRIDYGEGALALPSR